MSAHVHVHPPPELGEAGSTPSVRRERRWELVATVLLAVATLGIAWSGYQAARWSGLQSEDFAGANTIRSHANRASTAAGQDRLQDLVNFNRWLEVTTEGDAPLASLYQRRFRAEFLPAFNAWLAQDPLHNPAAVASPLAMPQYHLARLATSDRLEREADRRFDEARRATEHTDDYVLTTVFFAAVLFFAGISLRFEWERLRVAVLGLGVVFLGYGLVRLATLPTH
jgi:hypothetical protein